MYVVNPKKEDTYKEGLLGANWAKLLKNSLAAISTQRPLTQTALHRGACFELRIYTVFVPSDQPL